MTNPHLVTLFFLQLTVVLLACRVVGLLGRRFGQPQVVGEMVAGFLLGPSFFGWLTPGVQAQLFPPESLQILFVASQLGVVLFMFCVGLDFRPDLMRDQARRAAAISIAGIVVPFVLGGFIAVMLFERDGLFGGQVRVFHAFMFVGAAMSITAFPMLARIIHERGIAGTELGTLTLATGAIGDAAAWIMGETT
jgi:Kef-type K+ transport system membrane component KefB